VSANGTKGFTLLELLISILIIALLSVLVGGALSMAYRSVQKGEKKIEAAERMKGTLSLMDAQIQSAIPIGLTADDDSEYYFKGASESFTFVSNHSLWGGERGYVQATYRIETEPGGQKSLYLTESTVGIENEREVRLLYGVDDIKFEFLQSGLTETEGGWVSEWEDETVVPSKIRIQFVRGKASITRVIPVRMQEPNTHQKAPAKTLPAKG
jgi:prepilin-type N-terminal cleavage/methylation domain-containing protein